MTTEALEIRELITLSEKNGMCLEKPIQELFDECLKFISVIEQ